MNYVEAFSLSGKTALITGSSRGIGRAILLAFAKAGANVIAHGSRPGGKLEEAAAEARALVVKAAAVNGDLSDSAQVKKLHAEAVAALGGIDILVLNASLQIRKKWEEIPPDEFDSQMHINVRASLELMQLCAPHMRGNKWGRILTVGSVQQVSPHPDMLVYAASKSALVNMVKSLARQLAPEGITVNNLAPGVIYTDRNEEALSDENYRQKVLEKIPAGFWGEPEDCAGAALLLCSDAGRYITGQDLIVDGGMSLH
jgi:NAD(P)-dependent dehydrogenase (short-subunit alcohol dehydrogenase family)